jgi:ribosomal protein S18 acetylase RimI-like enzyme
MGQYQVRLAQLEDAQGIATVHVRAWQDSYQEQIPADYLQALSIDERTQRWQRILELPTPHGQIFVAAAGSILGFCSIGPSRDEDAVDNTGEIYAIYVAPESVGQGIGSALIRAGLATLAQDGYTEVTLWVLTINLSAQGFYRRHGFVADKSTKTESIGGSAVEEIRYRRLPQ